MISFLFRTLGVIESRGRVLTVLVLPVTDSSTVSTPHSTHDSGTGRRVIFYRLDHGFVVTPLYFRNDEVLRSVTQCRRHCEVFSYVPPVLRYGSFVRFTRCKVNTQSLRYLFVSYFRPLRDSDIL